MGKVSDAAEATREGKILDLLRATQRSGTKQPASEVTVAQAIGATTNGSILDLIQPTAAQGAAVRPTADPARIQRGRDLYNQLHKKGN